MNNYEHKEGAKFILKFILIAIVVLFIKFIFFEKYSPAQRKAIALNFLRIFKIILFVALFCAIIGRVFEILDTVSK